MDVYLPHGICLRWNSPLFLGMILSDLSIALAYFSIPAMLWYYLYKRRRGVNASRFRPLVGLFGAFIILCGSGHLVNILVLYKPWYYYQVLHNFLTGAVSIGTALLLWQALPSAIQFKTPEELAEINENLQAVIHRLGKQDRAFSIPTSELDALRSVVQDLKRSAGSDIHGR